MQYLIVLVALICAFLTAAPASAQECEASGTLVRDPAQPLAGEHVRLIATIDSPDDACRELVRSEPFVIISGAGGGELSLVPEGDSFVGTFTSPGNRWTATLYVVGTGAPLASFDVDTSANLTDIRFWYARSPGAVVIIITAVVLGVLAVVGQTPDYARPPRWRIRLVAALRRGAGRVVTLVRSRFRAARPA